MTFFTDINRASAAFASSSSQTARQDISFDLSAFIEAQKANRSPIVPDVFYNTEIYNQIGLIICQTLEDAFQDCKDLLRDSGQSKYFNVASVCFHQLVRILCPFAFEGAEVELIKSHHFIPEQQLTTNLSELNALAKKLSAFDGLSFRQKTKEKLLSLYQLPQLLLHSNIKRLKFSSEVPIELNQIFKTLRQTNSSGLDFHISRLTADDQGIPFPDFERQSQIVLKHIQKISEKIRQNLSFEIRFWDAALSATKNFLVNLPLKSRLSHANFDTLIVGSTANFEVRCATAIAKSRGIPVISIMHGDCHGVYDEPIVGYCMQSFADEMIGFGEMDYSNQPDAIFAKSLYPEDPLKYHPASATNPARLYKKETILDLSTLESPKFMYVPTSFSGHGRYGPYRDIHDIAYLKWQQDLLNLLSSEFPERVIWKRHVKEKKYRESIPFPGVQTHSDIRFEELIDQTDVFVFDYVSTALSVAAATNKPIVYFDIGLRRLTEQAQKAIQERCIYVKVNPQQAAQGFKQFLALQDKKCMNRFTPSFSLSRDCRSQLDVLVDLLTSSS